MVSPRVEIAADDSYSDDELQELASAFEEALRVETRRYVEFTGEIIAPIVIFMFVGISTGFLQGIGQSIWNGIKNKIADIVSRERSGGVSDLEFRIRTVEKTVRFRLHSDDPEVIRRAIDQFPKALEHAEDQGYPNEYYEFDEEWNP